MLMSQPRQNYLCLNFLTRGKDSWVKIVWETWATEICSGLIEISWLLTWWLVSQLNRCQTLLFNYLFSNECRQVRSHLSHFGNQISMKTFSVLCEANHPWCKGLDVYQVNWRYIHSYFKNKCQQMSQFSNIAFYFLQVFEITVINLLWLRPKGMGGRS